MKLLYTQSHNSVDFYYTVYNSECLWPGVVGCWLTLNEES